MADGVDIRHCDLETHAEYPCFDVRMPGKPPNRCISTLAEVEWLRERGLSEAVCERLSTLLRDNARAQ